MSLPAKWSYKILGTTRAGEPQAMLERLGADGWELVAVVETTLEAGVAPTPGGLSWVFKRPYYSSDFREST